MSESLLGTVCAKGVLCAVSVSYWRGRKQLDPADLGLNPAEVNKNLIQLGHKHLMPRESLQDLSLSEGRARAILDHYSLPFMGGLARYVPYNNLDILLKELEEQKNAFNDAKTKFLESYDTLREAALVEWRATADSLGEKGRGLMPRVIAAYPAMCQAFRDRFSFRVRMFQINAMDAGSDTTLLTDDNLDMLTGAMERRRAIAREAERELQSDLQGFVRESITLLREETSKLVGEVITSIDEGKSGVHQKTLNRLTSFIERFKSLNFAGDKQLETTLAQFQADLLSRSAEDYRNNPRSRDELRAGLGRLREQAMDMVRQDVSTVLSGFGKMGVRNFD